MLARRVSAEGRTRAYVGGRTATAADLRDARRRAALVLRPARAPQADARRRRSSRSSTASAAPGRRDAARGVRGGCTRASAALRGRARGAARAGRRARPRARPARVGARRDRGAAPTEAEEAELARRARAAAPPRGAAARGRRRASRRWRPRAARAARRPRWPAAPRGRSRRCAASTPRSTRWPIASARWRVEADDLAGELRRYGEAVDAPPGRLDEVEERLAAVRAAQAQARRHDRGGARARRGLPRAARRARGRRGGAGGRDGGARGACGPSSPARAGALRAAREAAAPALGDRGRASVLAGAGHGGRELRGAAGRRATATGPTRRRRGRVPDRAEPGRARRARCARPPRAASSRA